jgi:uncharacterized damage-inducible protein DinB
MTTMLEPMLREFQAEVAITRRVLDRVPADKLTWKPHAKSMTLGQLALHIASVPGALSKLAQLDEFDAAQANFIPPQPKSLAEIREALAGSIRDAEECLGAMTDERASGNWRMLLNGHPIMTQPRVGVLRSIMLNHWYHHRGQLSVYLRMLDVPVPVIYGRSADENPFA